MQRRLSSTQASNAYTGAFSQPGRSSAASYDRLSPDSAHARQRSSFSVEQPASRYLHAPLAAHDEERSRLNLSITSPVPEMGPTQSPAAVQAEPAQTDAHSTVPADAAADSCTTTRWPQLCRKGMDLAKRGARLLSARKCNSAAAATTSPPARTRFGPRSATAERDVATEPPENGTAASSERIDVTCRSVFWQSASSVDSLFMSDHGPHAAARPLAVKAKPWASAG